MEPDPDFDRPGDGELLAIYHAAQMYRSIDGLGEIFPAISPTSSNPVYCALRLETKLVAIGKATLDDRLGTISDVFIHPDHRGKGYFNKLVTALKEKTEERNKTKIISWRADVTPLRDALKRDLDLAQTIFGVSMGLGSQQLAVGVFNLIQSSRIDCSPAFVAIYATVILAIALLGYRFYWGVATLRRILLRRAYNLDSFSRRMQINVFLPILFFQAFIFYLICRTCLSFVETGSHRTALTYDVFRFNLDQSGLVFVVLSAVLLWVNVFWLIAGTGKDAPSRELFWAKNNLVFAYIISCVAYLAFEFPSALSMMSAVIITVLLLILNDVLDLQSSRLYLLGDYT